jgi:hypothetical protein
MKLQHCCVWLLKSRRVGRLDTAGCLARRPRKAKENSLMEEGIMETNTATPPREWAGPRRRFTWPDWLGELERKLLQFGGQRMCPRNVCGSEQQLLTRGRLVELPVKMRKGGPHLCHVNAAALWAKYPDRYTLVEGYALADDGVWLQHSWAVDQTHIQETTHRFDRYFGVELGQDEALGFWFCNYFPHRYPNVARAQREFIKRLKQAEEQAAQD